MDGHDMNNTMMPHQHMKMMMHMTFYWGNNAEILFSGWPGAGHGRMYGLSLLVVFLLAAFVEWISRSKIIKPGSNDVVSGLLLTLLHALRMGIAYLVMLALMSFNGGVFIAAVAGHALGFLVFGTKVVFGSGQNRSDDPSLPPYRKHNNPDLPPLSC